MAARDQTGKTHLLAAIAQELARSGRKVLFTTCNLLVQELLIAKRDLKLSRVLKRLAGFGVLLIDDPGYVQQSREEMEVLFTLLAERYERGSVMLTSDLPFSQWEQIFVFVRPTAWRAGGTTRLAQRTKKELGCRCANRALALPGP